MTASTPSEALPDYLDRLSACDLRGAVRVCLRLADAGHPVDAIVSDVLAPAQAEIGARWERAAITVAREHSATAITDAALAALAQDLPEPAAAAPLLVICVEGEWHSLPARMTATRLEAHGWPVRFLGASAPAEDITAYADALGPLAAVISATVASFLPGAARTLAAVHRTNVPALAGGAAFGGDATRADAVGADAWAADIADADRQLAAWQHGEPPSARPADHVPPGAATHQRLAAAHAQVIESAYSELWDRLPALRSYTQRQLDHTRADLSSILEFLEAAVLIDDPSVATDLLRWLSQVLESRGVPASVLPPSLAALTAALEEFPDARRCLSDAADAAGLRSAPA